tara:strand:- start:625 stop:1110 length:486 start_codon:yes stop_codon:yes gene_type:complete
MSKRSRDDFSSTQVLKRLCPDRPYFPTGRPYNLKRLREEEENTQQKKQRYLETLKRAGSSTIEENLRKRMRYSKPSAEEAIAFLLPRIQELRSLYTQEVQINSAKSSHILEAHQLLQQEMESKKQLVSNNKTILIAYNKVVNENNKLQREMALIKYRLNLM